MQPALKRIARIPLKRYGTEGLHSSPGDFPKFPAVVRARFFACFIKRIFYRRPPNLLSSSGTEGVFSY
jgi:hypothetical protein